MKLLKIIKKQLLALIIFILLFEMLFQIFFFFDFKFIKQPILFYNGYCDQRYWNLNNINIKFSENISYHPILSYKKSEVFIPNKFEKNASENENKFSKSNVSLYGSSYINHTEFKNILNNFEYINFTNYALRSYALDQIYLSYKLTSHLNQNRTIVFGFLLEDLDRSIFYKREYQKALFVLESDKFQLKNVPIDQNIKKKKVNDFYLFRFLYNFYELIINEFDPRLSKCLIDHKKKLFRYYFKNIENEAKKFNQEIIVITFNLQEDITKTPSWRYNYIKNYFTENNILHVDSLEILKNKLIDHNEKIENYFGLDGHNNKKSYEYIFNEFLKIYKAI